MDQAELPPLWAHQREDLDASWDRTAAAVHWEPRLGKSRLVVETAARLRDAGRVDAAVVVAPNGVHLGWTREQVPTYWRGVPPTILEWRSSRAGTARFAREAEAALAAPGFVWVACNVEALHAGSPLERYLLRLARRRRCLLVLDESHYCKNPRAKRTRSLARVAELCPYRRTLTGTPTPQGPFDLWAQFNLLDPAILGPRFTTFRARYGVWKRVRYGLGPLHDELVEYQNLDELARRIAPHTLERRKADCLDLPDRAFSRRYFEMPPEHARVYRELRDDLVARLDSGEEVSAPQAMVCLMRLQQVSRGHAVTDAGEPVDLDPPRPSVEAAVDVLEGHAGKAAAWCRFRRDAELLAAALEERAPGSTAVCTSRTPPEERAALRARLNDPSDRIRWWVGTPATGGVGVDLGGASLTLFYSHGWNLAERLQALERNYGSTQRAERVEVVDLVAADTADERALAVLARKEDLAVRLTAARLRDLL